MQLFLNEWSLQSQFAVVDQLQVAAAELVRVVAKVRSMSSRGRCRFFRSERLDQRQAVGQDHFLQSMNRISDKEVRDALFDVVFNQTEPAPWEGTRRHNPPDAYGWEEHDVTDTSMAELAERLLVAETPSGGLINFVGSALQGEEQIAVVKNASQPGVQIPCFELLARFSTWMASIPGAVPYCTTSRGPPRDDETCLVDFTRFEPTARRQQSRVVYQERTTRDQYYVDNLHFGGAAHLEVFSRHGIHKGEASLDGVLDETKRDLDKTIDRM